MISGLNGLVGLLFLMRPPARQDGDARSRGAALPALLLGGFAVKLAGATWPMGAQLLFCLGGLGALLSLAALGRSFALLPARRALVAKGPYGAVRHPAYLGELLMVWGAAWAVGGGAGLGLGLLALPLIALRIAAEERLLAGDPSWAAYRGRVRFRLLPGLW